jgi:hypothetical protein
MSHLVVFRKVPEIKHFLLKSNHAILVARAGPEQKIGRRNAEIMEGPAGGMCYNPANRGSDDPVVVNLVTGARLGRP